MMKDDINTREEENNLSSSPISTRIPIDLLGDARLFLSEYYKKERYNWDKDGSGIMNDYYVTQYAVKFIALHLNDFNDFNDGVNFYSTRQVAKILNKSVSRIRQLCLAGQIKATKIQDNSDWLIFKDEFDMSLKPKVERS